MRPKIVALVLAVLLLAALAPRAGAASEGRRLKVPGGPSLPQTPRFVPNQLLVQFQPRVKAPQRRQVHRQMGGRAVTKLLLPNTYVIELSGRSSVRDAAKRYRSFDAVRNASPNYLRYKMAAPPDDPRFPELWGLHNTGQMVQGIAGTSGKDIGALDAWDIETGKQGTVVAVIDDGVNYGHEDLAGNIFDNPLDPPGGGDQDGNGLLNDFRGWDFSSMTNSSFGDNNPMGSDTHGTHVAGTIGAEGNNSTGVTGVSQDVSLLPIRVFKDNHAVPLGAVINAYVYAGMMKADVANGSFGGLGGSLLEVEALEFSRNTLFVVAAGNDSENNDLTPVFPCNYANALVVDNVVCVAATDPHGGLAVFSNFGPNTVHLAAPGTAILSTSRHATMLEEGFEATIPNWDLDPPWATTAEASFIGDKSLTDSPGAPYASDPTDTSATTPVLDLSGKTGCFLEHLMEFDLKGGDAVHVEVSTDGGISWLTPPRRTYGGVESGAHDVIALTPLKGSAAARVRYRLHSDGVVPTGDGIHLDEVAIRCNSMTGTDGGYQYLEGTSMASPHVAGAAALMFSLSPGANPFSVRRALMESGDPLPVEHEGAIISGKRLNAHGLLGEDAVPLAVPTLSGPTLSQPFQKKTSITLRTSTSGAAAYWIKLDRTRFSSLNFTRRFQQSSGTKTVNLAAGATHCISSNSIEPGTGNESNFSKKKCTSVPVNNKSLRHSSGWSKRSGSGYFMNTFSRTKRKGASLSLAGGIFDRLALVATRCLGCGKVGLFFGKQRTPFKRVSLSSTRTKKRQIISVFNRSGGPFKSKITIRVLTSRKPVKIEGFGVLQRPFLS